MLNQQQTLHGQDSLIQCCQHDIQIKRQISGKYTGTAANWIENTATGNMS